MHFYFLPWKFSVLTPRKGDSPSDILFFLPWKKGIYYIYNAECVECVLSWFGREMKRSGGRKKAPRTLSFPLLPAAAVRSEEKESKDVRTRSPRHFLLFLGSKLFKWHSNRMYMFYLGYSVNLCCGMAKERSPYLIMAGFQKAHQNDLWIQTYCYKFFSKGRVSISNESLNKTRHLDEAF